MTYLSASMFPARQNGSGGAEPVRTACFAMRSRFEAVLADTDRDPADRHAAGAEALAEVNAAEALLSAYRENSDLYACNERASREPVVVDARIFSLLGRAAALWEYTGGAFDPAVGPLLQLWGISGGPAPTAAPTPEAVAATLARCGMGRVVSLDPEAHAVRYAAEGVRLDPGAVGKGWALDMAAETLRDAGMRSALLHGGTSSVYALGAPPGAPEGWRVSVQDPAGPDGASLKTVLLRDAALSVSAVHGKTVEVSGRVFGHVIDPRTGWPVTGATLAAVVTENATDGDALSTALLVLGAEGIPALTERFPDAAFLVAGPAGLSAAGGIWEP